MNRSENINELATALSSFQGEVENATKSASNPFFKSKYADLGEVLNTIRPVMAKYGLSLTQFPSFDGNTDVGTVSVESTLLHSSGQWMSSILPAPVAKGITPQSIGSAITYCRRYAAAAILGIGQEDDDGNAASGKSTPGDKAKNDPPKSPEAAPKPKTESKIVWTATQEDEWKVLLDKIGTHLRVQSKLDELDEFTNKVLLAKASFPAADLLVTLRTREKEFAAQTTEFIKRTVKAPVEEPAGKLLPDGSF